ncbi:ead/Ea22-like family protein [Enterobacter kobei]|uniref:ead/Ea22-like family protein n=1 Tax=Enterobacter kobei TaxID=208224 RepID=UPI00349FF0D7
MSNIDKRALREAAANAKIAGEAPVMPFDQRITALNDFLKHCTPETVLVLLDEIAELEQRHCGTALLEREEMHTKTLGRMLDELDAKDKQIADLKEAFSIALSAAGIDVPAAAGKGEAS